MTGMNTPHLGILSNSAPRFRPEVARTLGGTFKAAGYKCGYVGKWHLGAVNIDAGDRRRLGFDDYWAANVSEHRYYKWKYYTGSGEPVPQRITWSAPSESQSWRSPSSMSSARRSISRC